MKFSRQTSLGAVLAVFAAVAGAISHFSGFALFERIPTGGSVYSVVVVGPLTFTDDSSIVSWSVNWVLVTPLALTMLAGAVLLARGLMKRRDCHEYDVG